MFGSVIVVDKWSPALQIRTVLLSIQGLMSAPNPDDPLDNDVADHWKTNEKAAIETGIMFLWMPTEFYCFVAREWTNKYAS